MSAPDVDLHVWASMGAPDGPVLRVTAHVCGECFALVTDRRAHAVWHAETLAVLVDERVELALQSGIDR